MMIGNNNNDNNNRMQYQNKNNKSVFYLDIMGNLYFLSFYLIFIYVKEKLNM